MRFLLMTTDDPSVPTAPPTPDMFVAMENLIEEMTKAGVILAAGGLDPNPIYIKSQDGQVSVVDGPFTEAKEAILGFSLVECNSREEAIEYSKMGLRIVGDGTSLIQQVF